MCSFPDWSSSQHWASSGLTSDIRPRWDDQRPVVAPLVPLLSFTPHCWRAPLCIRSCERRGSSLQPPVCKAGIHSPPEGREPIVGTTESAPDSLGFLWRHWPQSGAETFHLREHPSPGFLCQEKQDGKILCWFSLWCQSRPDCHAQVGPSKSVRVALTCFWRHRPVSPVFVPTAPHLVCLRS